MLIYNFLFDFFFWLILPCQICVGHDLQYEQKKLYGFIDLLFIGIFLHILPYRASEMGHAHQSHSN